MAYFWIVLAGALVSARAQDPAAQQGASRGSDTGPFRYVIFSWQNGANGWEIGVAGDGSGSWVVDRADNGTPIHVSAKIVTQIAAGERAVAAKHCETVAKHIAQTGKKSIVFTMSSASVACEYNYSDDQALNSVTDIFLALSQTMQMGAELTRLHRYDRLGLDAEMDVFANEVKGGRAMEVQNIAPVLQSIIADDRVIERVRRTAARLLQDAGVAASSTTDK